MTIGLSIHGPAGRRNKYRTRTDLSDPREREQEGQFCYEGYCHLGHVLLTWDFRCC
jgi:hypothetical protein